MPVRALDLERSIFFFIKLWKPLPSKCIINLEAKSTRESLKRKIFTRGGSGPLQIVLEPDIRQCIS